MKFKLTLASTSLALLMLSNGVIAQNLPFYDVKEITVNADGALYGPFPAAMSGDAEFIATYSHKASLSSNIDVGLPFTFNRRCQYDSIVCEFQFYGSEEAGQKSYYNAYQAWRNAQSDASDGFYERYMFANTLLGSLDDAQSPYLPDNNSSDVKTTDVTNEINGERFAVGYASAPYEDGVREFARRAYVKSVSGGIVTSLLPDVFIDPLIDDKGGFSSAYKLKQVTYADDSKKTLVIGAASRSFPRNNDEYFEYCYNTTEYDYRATLNYLDRCPGFDTQAWAWDITDFEEGQDVIGFPLATHWLENNETRQDSLTFSASAFDMTSSGIAVGMSTFAYRTGATGGHQRAIIMEPLVDGTYAQPIVIDAATDDISDHEDWIYNTWALTISEGGIITGNREYEAVKGRNKPIEFFVYDHNTGIATFPLKDKKITTTKQRAESSGSQYSNKSGANSRIYDANEAGLMVGEIDDYDQIDPAYEGSVRSQTAFLFDNSDGQAWIINDLICSKSVDSEGVETVTSPLIRIRSARVINDQGIILAEGYKYDDEEDYRNKRNAIQTAFKLTPSTTFTPNESPNCWQSSLLESVDAPYERQGAATFWMWLLALPLVYIRRVKR